MLVLDRYEAESSEIFDAVIYNLVRVEFDIPANQNKFIDYRGHHHRQRLDHRGVIT